MRFILAFGVVLVLAATASAWLARQGKGAGRPGLALLGGLSLGGQRQVVAVRVGRHVLILGLADKQVSLLETLTDPAEIELLAPGDARAVPGAAGAILAALRGGWRRG